MFIFTQNILFCKIWTIQNMINLKLDVVAPLV